MKYPGSNDTEDSLKGNVKKVYGFKKLKKKIKGCDKSCSCKTCGD